MVNLMPTARFYKLPEEKRRLILDVAQAEFALHGFDKASLNHIIAEAGLSKGAIYYYFENKADLFVAVVMRLVEQFPQIVQKIYDTEDPTRFWAVAYDVFLQIVKMKLDPSMFRIMRELLDPKISAMIPEHVAEMMQFSTITLARVVETGQRLGVIRADLPAQLLVHMVQGLMMAISSWLLDLMQDGRRLDPEGYTRFFVELLRQLLDRGQAMSGSLTDFISPVSDAGEETKSRLRRPSDLSVWLQWTQAGRAVGQASGGPAPEGVSR